ncbi:PLC-like phosphodiesterase [Phaeosphaeriaceae sp. PMI808]|nr:PLC-like phosphodiesterase [Phaeosphaeriaceae sp. PMI808]
MPAPITVRNLTPGIISITRIEQFGDPNTLQTKARGYFFSQRKASPTTSSAPELGEHAESFTYKDVNIALEPFESFTLAHNISEQADDTALTTSEKTLRLTIEDAGGFRHRIDVHPSYTQKSSQKCIPLSATSSTSYTALFHPSKPISHLTIHKNHLYNYQRWMSTLPDTLPLSAISIPGTHNSHTHYRALPSVRCQNVDVATQLANGIRFLDIRLQPPPATDASTKDLYLVHGAFPISLSGPKYFAPLLETCYAFLSANPTETILISLKREGIGGATDDHLSSILSKHYIEPNQPKWYTSPQIPYLGATRGKLVLIRRYTSSTHAIGLDASSWPHNSPHAPTPSFCIQDFCDVMTQDVIPTKLDYVNAHLVRAAACHHHVPGATTDATNPVPPGPLYLNFVSASNFWVKGCWPEAIAKRVMGGVEAWLCRGHFLDVVKRGKSGDGGTGVLIMDCVGENGDWDIVRLVVGMNMGVLKRMGM